MGISDEVHCGNMGFFAKSSSLFPLYLFLYFNTTELGFSISKFHGWELIFRGIVGAKDRATSVN